MTPTPKLRFVERESHSRNGEHFVMPLKIRVLQQWWTVTGTLPEFQHQYGEWRDVPLEVEA